MLKRNYIFIISTLYGLICLVIPLWNFINKTILSFPVYYIGPNIFALLLIAFLVCGLSILVLEFNILKGNRHSYKKEMPMAFISIFMMLISFSLVFFTIKTERNVIDLKWLKAIHVQNLPPIEYKKIFDKEQFRTMAINDMDDFYNAANSEFNQYQNELTRTWGIQSPTLLKTLFFMNLVSNMWGYGNKVEINKGGCVENNEDTLFQTVQVDPDTIQHYLNTDIGCCIDSARLLHFLLDRAQIKNRYVLNPGHIFNEVFIGEKWMAFDPTVNFWWHSSWEKIQNEPLGTPIEVTIFPSRNLLYKDKFYRERLGALQLSLIMQAAYKYSKNIEHPEEA